MSNRDFVTDLDFEGKSKYRNELEILESHPDAKFWDHENGVLKGDWSPFIHFNIRSCDSISRWLWSVLLRVWFQFER